MAIIITVGISLLDNIWQLVKQDPELRTPDTKDDILRGLREYYERYYSGFSRQLGNNCDRLGRVDFPCAEVESLVYWLAEQEQIHLQTICLLHTKTDASRGCASQIASIIAEKILGLDCFQSKLGQNAPPRIFQKGFEKNYSIHHIQSDF